MAHFPPIKMPDGELRTAIYAQHEAGEKPGQYTIDVADPQQAIEAAARLIRVPNTNTPPRRIFAIVK